LGWCYLNLRELDKAIEYFNKSISLNPSNPESHFNLATTYFLQGNFSKELWQKYEYRFLLQKDGIKKYNLPKPEWQEEDINGKKLYVHYEQGFGDTIMFGRYLKILASMGAEVFFRPQDGLISVLKNSDLDVNIIDTPIDNPGIEYDYYVSLMSLPFRLNITINNPPLSSERYICSDIEKVEKYKKEYFSNNKFKVGIFWQGNPKGFKNRALPLECCREIFNISDIQFYSFQKGYGIEQLQDIQNDYNIVDLGSTFNDFSDTVAALENLDLLITIDSSVAHIAGAMKKKTWVLLPFVPEWRWGLDGNTTPWYESLKLYRQKTLNDWHGVVQDVVKDLKFMLNQ